MTEVKYLIIGAGISGLSFADQKANQDYVIVEKDDHAGGLCKSFSEQGFIWDVAGHFFHFHSQSTREYYDFLMADKVQRLVNKCAKVYYSGKYIDAPFQYNIHQLSQEEFFECLTDLFFTNSFYKNKEDKTFGDYVVNNYGNGIAKKFLIPYNEKLYACSADHLDKNSMGEFLPKLTFESLMNHYRGMKESTYNDQFSYPVDGCGQIIEALMERLDKSRVHLGEKVCSVNMNQKMVVTTKNTYRYQYLINTSPFPNFISLIGENSEVELSYNKVLVFNIGFDKPSIDKNVCWIYYPGEEIFYRVGFYNNIAGTDRLSLYVEIGFRSDEIIDEKEAFNNTIIQLKNVGIITNHKVEAYMSYIIDPGYAHITENGKNYVREKLDELMRKDVYMIGRYAKWQYSAMDDSFEQAIILSEKI